MRVLYYLLGLFLLSSCFKVKEEKDLYGYYTPLDYENSFDTILLKPQFIYNRKVYDKERNIVLDMNGKWYLQKNNQIKFNSFYLNLDDDLIKFPESTKDTSMEVITDMERRGDGIEFCVGYYPNQNCYQKIK